MENVTGMRKLTRTKQIRKPTDEILRSEPETLSLLLTEFKKPGESIVNPQRLDEMIDAMSSDDTYFDSEGVFSSIREVLVSPFGLALALKQGRGVWEFMHVYDDSLDVKELLPSDYDILREEILNPRGAAVVPQGFIGVASQPGKGLHTKANKKYKQ